MQLYQHAKLVLVAGPAADAVMTLTCEHHSYNFMFLSFPHLRGHECGAVPVVSEADVPSSDSVSWRVDPFVPVLRKMHELVLIYMFCKGQRFGIDFQPSLSFFELLDDNQLLSIGVRRFRIHCSEFV